MAQILDDICKIELSDAQEEEFTNELRNLFGLAVGLNHLYEFVRRVEQTRPDTIPTGRVGFVWAADDPECNKQTSDLVKCVFDWYSVSICNYIELVGWIGDTINRKTGSAKDGVSKRVKNYVKEIAGAAHTWRDKVGAHVAMARDGR